MRTIEFNRQKAEELRGAYNRAVAEGEDTFTFEGFPILTAYAKYLLEYLDMNFKPDTKTVSESGYINQKHRIGRNGT